MCFSRCPYERPDGSCGGLRYAVRRQQPHCVEDDVFSTWEESFQDDWSDHSPCDISETTWQNV